MPHSCEPASVGLTSLPTAMRAFVHSTLSRLRPLLSPVARTRPAPATPGRPWLRREPQAGATEPPSDGPPLASPRRSWGLLDLRVVGPVSLAIAAASLLLPFAPNHDGWAWLVWGRELAHFELDTTGGPSWKPLPVVVTALSSPFGEAALEIWLGLVRAAALVSLALAFRLAARIAGPVAGLLAPILILLTPNSEARFLRYVIQANAEPLLVALLLWAIERHLDGRRGHALALGVAAALIRPEVWPFLGLYTVWLWFAQPRLRLGALALVSLVPLLWLGGDWLGSGGALTGAERARVTQSYEPLARLGEAASDALEVTIAPVWWAAVVAVLVARRRGEILAPVLGAASVAWLGLVVAMSAVLSFYSDGRFELPGGVVLSVLAAAGLVETGRAGAGLAGRWVRRFDRSRVRDRRARASSRGRRPLALIARTTVVLVIAALVLSFALPRLTSLPDQPRVARARAESNAELRALARAAGGAEGLAFCGPVAVDRWRLALEAPMALAWELEVPMADIPYRLPNGRGHVFARRDMGRFRRLSRRAAQTGRRGGATSDGRARRTAEGGAPRPSHAEVELVDFSPEWGLFAVGCRR